MSRKHCSNKCLETGVCDTDCGNTLPLKSAEEFIDIPDFLRRPDMVALDNLPIAHHGCNCDCHKMAGVNHCIPCCSENDKPIINFNDT